VTDATDATDATTLLNSIIRALLNSGASMSINMSIDMSTAQLKSKGMILDLVVMSSFSGWVALSPLLCNMTLTW
jgi:hypothetical protein